MIRSGFNISVYIVIVNFKGRCIPQKEPKTRDKEIRDEEMEWWSIGERGGLGRWRTGRGGDGETEGVTGGWGEMNRVIRHLLTSVSSYGILYDNKHVKWCHERKHPLY